jgi:diguanylate cyclase (GGDEF)-like protein/PAS domain S-box-containing protein
VGHSNHHQFRIACEAATVAGAADCYPYRETDDTPAILRLALEGAGAGVWQRDLVTEIVLLCPQARRMLGLPESHSGVMEKHEWLKLTDAVYVERMQQWLDSPNAVLAPHVQEFRSGGPDGEPRWIRVFAQLLPDQDGRFTRLVGLMFDDTDRKRAEDAIREREERLLLIQEAALIGTFTIGADGLTVGSRQFYRNLGMPADTPFLDRHMQMERIHPDDRERVEQDAAIAVQSADGQDSEYRIHRADTGELRWIFSRLKFERADDGRLTRVFGAHLDVTEPKRAEAALRESVALNQRIVESSADCVMLIDLAGRLLFMNRPGLAALEVEDASRLWEKNWAELWPREERAKVEAAIQAAREGQTGRFNGGCPTENGIPKWWDVVVTPICDEEGRPRQLLAISRDLTEHRNQMAQIRWTASHDMLTELPNRRFFQDRLEKALVRARALGHRVGLLQLDVDDFKQTNDALGHHAGDVLLKSFAERLRSSTQGKEMVARLGGDEFAIIVPELTDSRPLSEIVKDIQAHLAEPFIFEGHVFDCRASIGKAVYPEHGRTVEDLLKSSDIALYAAKSAGRGKVRTFHPKMRAEMHQRLEMIGRARTALKDDLIFPHYQPKVRFETGAPAGFEALLRWQDPEGTIQAPAAIAAAFEDLDVAQALSERMQLRVLADMRRWLDQGVDFGHVAINASAAEFRQNDFAERLLDRVRSAGVPTSSIELEVTETVFLGRGAEYVDRALHLLSAAGVRIALDDFGTGYASLSHLKQFPVDIIKIDQSFVRNISVDPDDSAIIRALVGLGKSLAIGIVAEGIENHAQFAFLAELGCDYGQGYLFSRAVAAAEVPMLLTSLQKRVALERHPGS